MNQKNLSNSMCFVWTKGNNSVNVSQSIKNLKYQLLSWKGPLLFYAFRQRIKDSWYTNFSPILKSNKPIYYYCVCLVSFGLTNAKKNIYLSHTVAPHSILILLHFVKNYEIFVYNILFLLIIKLLINIYPTLIFYDL